MMEDRLDGARDDAVKIQVPAPVEISASCDAYREIVGLKYLPQADQIGTTF